jgi:hypothetical protein
LLHFVQKTADFVVKLLNLRIVDRRKKVKYAYLVASDALSLHHSPITINRSDDGVDYVLHTAAGLRVHNPENFIRVKHM